MPREPSFRLTRGGSTNEVRLRALRALEKIRRDTPSGVAVAGTHGGLVQLGFMHLHHFTPKPDGYEFPYPDFLWLVYVSEAGSADACGRVVDDYEEEAVFRPAAETRTLELSGESRVFLEAALSQV